MNMCVSAFEACVCMYEKECVTLAHFLSYEFHVMRDACVTLYVYVYMHVCSFMSACLIL